MTSETISVSRTTRGPATFLLAANYDPEIVPALAAYPVDEMYGKLPGDGVGGGRPRYLATPLSESGLRRYIRLLDQHGIAFNYLLNGACFGNHEWTRAWQKKVTALLAKLGEMGVRRVTVAAPFLLELVKRRFPEFMVKVGIYAQVDTPRRARVERRARQASGIGLVRGGRHDGQLRRPGAARSALPSSARRRPAGLVGHAGPDRWRRPRIPGLVHMGRGVRRIG